MGVEAAGPLKLIWVMPAEQGGPMYTGAQISLYPMSNAFVDIIIDAIEALSPWRERLKMETDDLSTVLIGPPEALIGGMRDLFVKAAAGGTHCVLHATLSRGCPGGPQLPGNDGDAQSLAVGSLEVRKAKAQAAVSKAVQTGQPVTAQFALYVMGEGEHMREIMGCIDFLKGSGVFDREKNFVTKLRGDAGPVFTTLGEALYRFGPTEGHVTLDLTVAANSPTKG
jgi:energy-coupling factor transport system substrate-specific component